MARDGSPARRLARRRGRGASRTAVLGGAPLRRHFVVAEPAENIDSIDAARDAAPAVAFSVDNTLTPVSGRTGCVTVNPSLDLADVCLQG